MCCLALPTTAPSVTAHHPPIHLCALCTRPTPLPLLAPATLFPRRSLLCRHHPRPAPTCPGSLYHLRSRGPLSFLISSKSSSLPGGPLLPHPFRLQLSPEPPHRAPSVPAVSAAAACSSLCTFLFLCGPFAERNRAFPHSSSQESRREQGASEQPGEKRGGWGRWDRGLRKQRDGG